jgi:D-alanyl-D-alanine dipeptidase
MNSVTRKSLWSTAALLAVLALWALAIFVRERTRGRNPAISDKPSPELKSRIAEMDRCRQLILVTVPDWNSVDARLQCFQRAAGDGETPWTEALPPIPAAIGRNGLGWGIGLHGTHPAGASCIKREGDGRAPAGAFRLREIFGYATSDEAQIAKFPYRQVTSQTAGVDDPKSRFYNRLVDVKSPADKEWDSAETMRRSDVLYRWGVVVEHNWQQIPEGGSCIFLHIWQGSGHGTAGCTAMAEDRMETLVRWLDREKHPLLVQLPEAEYQRLKQPWSLP